MNRREALAALGVVGLAGCLRLQGGGGERPTTGRTTEPPANTRTLTAAKADTDAGTATPGAGTYPTGLSEEGVSAFLFDTHERELARTSFSVDWTRIDLLEETVRRRQHYDVETGFALGTWTYDRGGPVTIFRSNEGGFWREELGDEYTYGEARHGYSIDKVLWRGWLEPVLGAGTWSEPSTVRERDPATWRVETTSFDETGAVPGHFRGQLAGLSASMTVDERGIIHSLEAEFEATDTNVDRVRQRLTFAVDAIGDVSVSEPSWLATAKERRPRVSAALTDDRNFVRFTLESGNALEPETVFTVYDELDRRNTIGYRLRDPVEPDETVYLYKEQEGPFHGQLARGSRPSNAEPVTLSSEYHMWADRGVSEYFGTVDL